MNELDFTGDGFADVVVSQETQLLLFRGSSAGLRFAGMMPVPSETPSITPSLRNAGDLDGDGRADLLVYTPTYARVDLPGATVRGYVHLYRGANDVLVPGGERIAAPTGSERTFASMSTSAGDMNGDGLSEIAAGSSDGRTAFFFAGTVGPLAAIPTSRSTPGDNSARVVRGVGDVDGDGFGDVVMFGEERGWLRFGGSQWQEQLVPLFVDEVRLRGPYVDGIGDVNGDGKADLLLFEFARNRISVAFGGTRSLQFVSWMPDTPSMRAQRVLSGAADFAPMGDLNGDGFDDVALWDDCWGDTNECRTPITHIYAGGPSGLSVRPRMSVQMGPWNTRSVRLTAVGDVNGDCRDDVIAVPTPFGTENRLYLLRGSATGFKAPEVLDGRTFRGTPRIVGALQ